MLALPIILYKYTAKGLQAYQVPPILLGNENIVAFRSQRVTIYYSWQLFCTLLHFSPSCYLLNDRHYKVMGILFPSSYTADEEDSLIIVRDGYVVFEQSRRTTTRPAPPPPPFLSHSKFISGVIFVKWMALFHRLLVSWKPGFWWHHCPDTASSSWIVDATQCWTSLCSNSLKKPHVCRRLTLIWVKIA